MLAAMAAIAETHDAAYRALTAGAGLVDRSAFGKLALTGDQAAEMLNGQVSNDVEALAPGTGCYAALLTNKGKMLGDLRVLATGDELLLITERSALQALFDQLRRGMIGWRAELHKRTLQQGLLSVIGPRAREVAGAGDLPADEHASVPCVGGAAAAWPKRWAIISRQCQSCLEYGCALQVTRRIDAST